jgi:hypothetical protein
MVPFAMPLRTGGLSETRKEFDGRLLQVGQALLTDLEGLE